MVIDESQMLVPPNKEIIHVALAPLNYAMCCQLFYCGGGGAVGLDVWANLFNTKGQKKWKTE